MPPIDQTCLDPTRRRNLLHQEGPQGIDAVRVSPGDRRKLAVTLLRKLDVHDDKHPNWPRAGTYTPDQFASTFHFWLRVEGGRRVTGLKVEWIEVRENSADGFGQLRLTLDRAGDDSRYALVAVPQPPALPFDDVYYRHVFQFAPTVATEDCGPEPCPVPPPPPAPIDYLAKDYASFRRLMLDRLARTAPGWTERRAADLGVALVEVLAYAADHLSYAQDAVATEAYLDTARLRVSVRRHARLVDYRMHDGCNARSWVQVQVTAGAVAVAGLTFFTEPGGPPGRSVRAVVRDRLALEVAAERDRGVFEPLPRDTDRKLDESQNTIPFYTWGDEECCLTKGATTASVEHHPSWDGDPNDSDDVTWTGPRVGDLLLIEEVIGPRTGNPADADPNHRHVVRLTRVSPTSDRPPGGGGAVKVLDVAWDAADALPFPVCISTRGRKGVSAARGNVVLVDHGLTFVRPELLEPELPPAPTEPGPCEARPLLGPPDPTARPRRFGEVTFKPPLVAPLTRAAPYPNPTIHTRYLARWLDRLPAEATAAVPAAAEFQRRVAGGNVGAWPESLLRPAGGVVAPAKFDLAPNPRDAAAALELFELPPTGETKPAAIRAKRDEQFRKYRGAIGWQPQDADRKNFADLTAWEARPDLLDSGPSDRHFVIEGRDDGTPLLRFGDGMTGRRPAPGTAFLVRYRIGNGAAANVGTGAITGVVGQPDGTILSVTNPLPAGGGTDPEPAEQVKLLAPTAFRSVVARAITAADYARLAERDDRVQRAAATFRRTPTGTLVRVALDLRASATAGAANAADEVKRIRAEVAADLNRYRRIGHDVLVVSASEVPLSVRIKVWAEPHTDPGRVRTAVRAELTPGTRPDGRRGFFDPDELTFGQRIDASKLVARVRAVTGVAAVQLKSLRRRGGPTEDAATTGYLQVAALEVPRLDADPVFPEFGELLIEVEGGGT